MNRDLTVLAILVLLSLLEMFGAWTFLSLPEPGTGEFVLATAFMISAAALTAVSVVLIRKVLTKLY